MLKNKIIIGISGKKRHGKNTFANILQDAFTNQDGLSLNAKPFYIVKQLAFATTIKQMASIMMGGEISFESDIVKDHEFLFVNGESLTGREILQKLGTEVGRNINSSIWLTPILYTISNSPADVFIITDVRFPNEYDFIKRFGGYNVRIKRPSIISTDTHESECALDNATFDFEVINEEDNTPYLVTHANYIANKILNLYENSKVKL